MTLVRDLRSARHARTTASLDATAPPYSCNAADVKPSHPTCKAVAAQWMQSTGVDATAAVPALLIARGSKLPSTPRLGNAACTTVPRSAGSTQRRGSGERFVNSCISSACGSKPRAEGLLQAAAALRAPHLPVTSPLSAPSPPSLDIHLATGTTSRSPRSDRQTGRSPPLGATSALSAFSSIRDGNSSVRHGISPLPGRASKASVLCTPLQPRLYAHGEARVPQPAPLSINNSAASGSSDVSVGAANRLVSARMGMGGSAAADPTSSKLTVQAASTRTARLSASTSSAALHSPAISPHSAASIPHPSFPGTETPSAQPERARLLACSKYGEYGENRGAFNFWEGMPPLTGDDERDLGASEMHADCCRVAFRRWQRHMASRDAYAALRRASMALGYRLVRARALRRWSALRIARQQNEINKLHQVAHWHLQTLLGATSDVGNRHDPVAATRRLLAKWSSALVTAAWNAWMAWLAEERNSRIPQMQVS